MHHICRIDKSASNRPNFRVCDQTRNCWSFTAIANWHCWRQAAGQWSSRAAHVAYREKVFDCDLCFVYDGRLASVRMASFITNPYCFKAVAHVSTKTDSLVRKGDLSLNCQSCDEELATVKFLPCGHTLFCDGTKCKIFLAIINDVCTEKENKH